MNQSNNPSPIDLAGSTAIVTGASRGFGRGIADALTAAGPRVIGAARSGATVSADAADPAPAGRLIDAHQPRTVVLCAGAPPPTSQLQVAAYAGGHGGDVESFVQSLGAALTAENVGKSVLDIAIGQQRGHRAYMLTATGLSPLE